MICIETKLTHLWFIAPMIPIVIYSIYTSWRDVYGKKEKCQHQLLLSHCSHNDCLTIDMENIKNESKHTI